MNINVHGWQELQVAQPINPQSIIANTSIGSTGGTFLRSTNALQAAWVASPLVFTGNNTKVVTWDVTDAQKVVDAVQWTFNHQMVNVAANIPPTLNNLVFMRAGAGWDNQLEIAMGGTACNNVQLTFLENLGTSGQFLNGAAGSVPVVSYGSGITGNQILHVTILQPGIYSVALVMVIAGSWSTFEMKWIVIP